MSVLAVRARLAVIAVVFASMTSAVFAVAPVAAGLTETVISASTRLLDAEKPYFFHLTVLNFNAGPETDIAWVDLTRRSKTGNHPLQTHEYRIEGVTASCTVHFASCSMDSGAHMGALGRINLSFAPTRAFHTVDLHCADNSIYGTRKVRVGKLTGAFTLRSRNSTFGTIRNSAPSGSRIPASLTARVTQDNVTADCPDDGACPNHLLVIGEPLSTQAEFVRLERRLGTANGSIHYEQVADLGGSVTVKRSIDVAVPATFLKVTSSSPHPLQTVTANMGVAEPLITGSATFKGGDPPSDISGGCGPERLRDGTLSGPFMVHFDGLTGHAWPGPTSGTARRTLPAGK